MEGFLHTLNWIIFSLIAVHYVVIAASKSTDFEEDSAFFNGKMEDSNFSKEIATDSNTHKDCCIREPKIKQIGSTVAGEEIRIDIGHCKKRCAPKKVLKRKRFQKLLEENPDIDPRELFLLHSSRRQRELSCPEDQICSDDESRVERVLTSQGEMSVSIIESCSCQASTKVCKRQPKVVVFHKGTPLESAVDVGECYGHCGQDTSCKPILSKTTSVQGPNGAECVSVIEDCACSPQCYRASHYEQHYHYVEGTQTVKIVDIGKCVGECDSTLEDQCVLRNEEKGECIMSLAGSTSECQPLLTRPVSITDRFGSHKNVSTISQCGCH